MRSAKYALFALFILLYSSVLMLIAFDNVPNYANSSTISKVFRFSSLSLNSVYRPFIINPTLCVEFARQLNASCTFS